MNESEFYKELMFKLSKVEDRETIRDAVESAEKFFGDTQAEEELEDFRENPKNPASLEDAVTKLGFELGNDSDLYSSYRDALSRIMYREMSEGIVVEKMQNLLYNKIEKGAEAFLDDFISKTQNGYSVDNRNMGKDCKE